MKITFFSAKLYDKESFKKANEHYPFELEFFETHLGPHSVQMVNRATVVCAFVNDKLTRPVLEVLAERGVKIIALRCAGFNNLDIDSAKELGLKVCRVPAYSPEAVAEHALAMIMTLNRKTHKAYNRVREQNFALQGLLGFDICGKTVGVIGTGNIGKAFIRIMLGMGCKVVAYDLYPDEKLMEQGVSFLPLEDLLHQSDIISLHCPLTEQTFHIIRKENIAMMKHGVMIINTGRGKLIDTKDAIEALKSGQVGYLGIDVYEQEEQLFFRDLSADIIQDDLIQRLMSFPNVLLTAHQAFFTQEALSQIAQVTLGNIDDLINQKEMRVKGALVV
ncbi:MAG TPA: 2-hydroxyacid dehydrogenase [Niabella sp.]|nr:2-hydroxyacid dehydrogenase [Niabella sp.]HQX73270.1 2-hydroxyacid dehydrogenase [Chitinophagaceae bacterium]HQW16291.1 2-hydroxyacid dehydrogenase [Niabella sp.]HQX21503.1 2-hydroxyacid dehydrogenase [Niabella sp.]HRB37167.1 2-hydroxyacid dehydrogenase [Niabella sp.]